MRAATVLICGALALALPAGAGAAGRGAARAASQDASSPAPASVPASAPEAAPAAGTQPVPGEAAVAPALTPGEEPAEPAGPRDIGILVRAGYFGLPDVLADSLFRMHPKVDGFSYGAEFRYHGAGGPRGVASVGIAVDRASVEADGLWQTDEYDEPWAASGKIEMTAVTVTGYANILPSWPVHPYVGLGIGAAYLEGSYRKDDDLVTVDAWFPALHVPVGLAVELGDAFLLSLEARFIDGISAGLAFEARF